MSSAAAPGPEAAAEYVVGAVEDEREVETVGRGGGPRDEATPPPNRTTYPHTHTTDVCMIARGTWERTHEQPHGKHGDNTI